MRFERKYRIENMSLSHVLILLKIHPASFVKIHPDRTINNIYFDTIHLASAQDNLDGISTRKKYRLRWYGEDQQNIENPILETKFKENLVGGKEHLALQDMKLHNLTEITKTVNDSIPSQHALQATLLNSYERSYWGTFDEKFRITIDSNLRFHSLIHSSIFEQYTVYDEAIIMEIKYEREDEAEFDRIAEMFPFRLSKNSKYVNGLFLTNP